MVARCHHYVHLVVHEAVDVYELSPQTAHDQLQQLIPQLRLHKGYLLALDHLLATLKIDLVLHYISNPRHIHLKGFILSQFLVVGSHLFQDVVADRLSCIPACSFKREVERAISDSAWIDGKIGFVFARRGLHELEVGVIVYAFEVQVSGTFELLVGLFCLLQQSF